MALEVWYMYIGLAVLRSKYEGRAHWRTIHEVTYIAYAQSGIRWKDTVWYSVNGRSKRSKIMYVLVILFAIIGTIMNWILLRYSIQTTCISASGDQTKAENWTRSTTENVTCWLLSLLGRCLLYPYRHKRGHYKMRRGVCPSVRRSVFACLDLTREPKGLRSQKIGTILITRVTHEPIYRSKGQRSRSPGRLITSGEFRNAQVKVEVYSIK